MRTTVQTRHKPSRCRRGERPSVSSSSVEIKSASLIGISTRPSTPCYGTGREPQVGFMSKHYEHFLVVEASCALALSQGGPHLSLSLPHPVRSAPVQADVCCAAMNATTGGRCGGGGRRKEEGAVIHCVIWTKRIFPHSPSLRRPTRPSAASVRPTFLYSALCSVFGNGICAGIPVRTPRGHVRPSLSLIPCFSYLRKSQAISEISYTRLEQQSSAKCQESRSV